MDHNPIGSCILDQSLLIRLSKLWIGPIGPDDIEPIEIALRSILVYENIFYSAKPGDAWTSNEVERDGIVFDRSMEYNPTAEIGGSNLIYELKPIPVGTRFNPILNTELNFLGKRFAVDFKNEVERAIPSNLIYHWQYLEFLDTWYEGEPDFFPDSSMWREEHPERMDKETFLTSPDTTHAVFHKGPLFEAEYFVRAHRMGYGICSHKPVSHMCSEHLFSKWPNHLFSSLSDEFKMEARKVCGHEISVPLPPILSLVLSVAKNRMDIPDTIVSIRDEFKKDRRQLWALLAEMWYAEKYSSSVKVLQSLEKAASSIYKSAFPEKFNTLSIALDVSKLSIDGIASAADKLLQIDGYTQNVKAISFANRLSMNIRRKLLNQFTIYKKHFSESEIEGFTRLFS